MFRKRALPIIFLILSFAGSAHGQDTKIALERALQSRYRPTLIGGGFMGIHGDNSIRRAGGVVVLLRDGLYGAKERANQTSNAVRNGEAEAFSGEKEVKLVEGDRFYVTAVYVGAEAVTIGLLGVRDLAHGKSSQVWSSVNFLFSADILAQGDPEKIYEVVDKWLIPEGTVSPATSQALPPSSLSVAPAISSPVSAASPATSLPVNTIELKPDMTREEIANVMGPPLQEIEFGGNRWMTYQAVVVTLRDGKLISVDTNTTSRAAVKIVSEPSGADVFLDGSFVSSTPSGLRLQAGTYKIAVKMSGYIDWEHDVKVLPGAEVTLNATLSR